MSIISRICGSLEARLNQPRLSIWRTIYFNFRTLPLSQAIKLPVFIYGRVRLYMLNGSIEFKDTPIKRGMVKIGINADSFNLSDGSGFISLTSAESKIIFKGPAKIALNSKIRVIADGILTFGEYAFIGSNIRIICNGGRVNIGAFSRIAFETIIMNSSFHHVYNYKKNSITRATRPIEIGNFNWIGNRTTLAAGTKTKEYSIIGAGSYLNRDYSSIEEEYPMIAGHPAKIITSGIKRIYSPELENDVIQWFNEHPNEEVYRPEEFNDIINNITREF